LEDRADGMGFANRLVEDRPFMRSREPGADQIARNDIRSGFGHAQRLAEDHQQHGARGREDPFAAMRRRPPRKPDVRDEAAEWSGGALDAKVEISGNHRSKVLSTRTARLFTFSLLAIELSSWNLASTSATACPPANDTRRGSGG
jgi:hypothetical protein